MEELIHLGELAVWTAAVADEEKPVSLLIVGHPESGKSELILALGQLPFTLTLNDVTAYSLVQKILRGGETTQRPVLLLPDLLNPLSRQQAVANTLLSMLAAYIAEGIQRVETKFISLDLKQPLRGSLITSITVDELRPRLPWWRGNGFLTRFLAVSYSYPKAAEAAIRAYHLEARHNNTASSRIALPDRRIPVAILPAVASSIGPGLERLWLQYQRAWGLEGKSYGFRFANQLRCLYKAEALRNGQDCVTTQTRDLVNSLIERYGNLEMREAR